MPVPTTHTQIDAWFDKGVSDGKRWMVVLCDTYDWEDYPVYFDTEDAARLKMKDPGNMQKVMECYDLQGNKADQLGERRAMALAPAS